MVRDRHSLPAPTPDAGFLERHQQIVKPIAGRLARQLRVTHELEDVIRTGVLGLVRAAATYDPGKGTERFWAWSCIRLEILSNYACGRRQHSGGDGYEWASRRLPISAAVNEPAPIQAPEPPPLPKFEVLSPPQQKLLGFLYEDGYSERAVVRGRLLGTGSRRTISDTHASALGALRGVLKSRSA